MVATARMCVDIDRSELSTSVLKLVLVKAVVVDCSPARLVQGAATSKVFLLLHHPFYRLAVADSRPLVFFTSQRNSFISGA